VFTTGCYVLCVCNVEMTNWHYSVYFIP